MSLFVLKMKILFSLLITLFILISSVQVEARLSSQQMNRINSSVKRLGQVEPRSVKSVIHEFQQYDNVEGNIQIFETVVSVYRKLAQKYELDSLKAKQRLLEKVRLNMAYLQMGGLQVQGGGDNSLNNYIQRELRKHLPERLTNNEQLFYTLQE